MMQWIKDLANGKWECLKEEAKKLKKTLQLKLDNDAETVDALKELSTFFLVIRLISIDFLILHCSKGDDQALHLRKAEK